MSYRHIEAILPEAEHYRHRPSPAQFIAALDCMVRRGWCREVKSAGAYGFYRSAAEVRERLRAAPEAVVIETLACGSETPPPDEWPSDEPEFTPDLCEDVKIVSSPWLLLATHGGVESGSVKCPDCGADVLRHIRTQQDEEIFSGGDKRPEFVLVDNNYNVPADTCPSCGNPLRHEEMFLRLGDFEDRAPFFHFTIQITAIRQPSVSMVYFDPLFLAELSDAIGVPLRSISEYS